MEDRTITLIDNEGKEILCDILFTYHYDKLDRNYVVFMDRNSKKVSACQYVESTETTGKLSPVETDEEWTMLEELLNDYVGQMEAQGCGGSCSGCSGCESGCEGEDECCCQNQ